MERLKIGELAERTATTPQTIRYYESLGLLEPLARESGSHRRYGDDAERRLNKIAALQEVGLSLEEIRSVIDLYFVDGTGLQGKQKVIDILRRHLQETESRINELSQFRSELIRNIERIEGIVANIKKEEQ
ncbi:MAG: MerR family transcriptional regulator [Alkalispirochaetaceae bacterium]